MKNLKSSLVFFLLAVVVLSISIARASTIELDWDYSSGGVSSYELTSITTYVDGVPSCNSVLDGETTGTLFCENGITLGVHSFTVAGQMRNGRQTPHSEPVVFNVTKSNAPVIRSLRIVVDNDGEEIILVYP